MFRAGVLRRWGAILAGGLCVLGGCAGVNRPDLEVAREASLADQSIEVDVIGTDAGGAPKYLEADVGKYFSTKSALRSSAPKHTLKFSAGGEDVRTLSGSDPVWKKWENASTLVLLANIPGMTNKGAADPRRTVISLTGAADTGNQVKVRMSEEGLAVLPPEKPKN
jgi:hypothetical protein